MTDDEVRDDISQQRKNIEQKQRAQEKRKADALAKRTAKALRMDLVSNRRAPASTGTRAESTNTVTASTSTVTASTSRMAASTSRQARSTRRKMPTLPSASTSRREQQLEATNSDSSQESESLCITCGANYYSENNSRQRKWAGCDNISCENWMCGDCLPDNFNYDAPFICENC